MERERCEIRQCQRLVAVAGGDPSERAEPVAAGGSGRLARDVHAPRVAHAHPLDTAGAVHQDADAAPEVVGDFRHLAGQLVRDDFMGSDAASIQALEPVLFGR
jgi:hypothetical protein